MKIFVEHDQKYETAWILLADEVGIGKTGPRRVARRNIEERLLRPWNRQGGALDPRCLLRFTVQAEGVVCLPSCE